MDIQSNDSSESIDLKALFRFLISKWYFFLISVSLGYFISVAYLRYQDSIFSVSSTILIAADNSQMEKSLGGLDFGGVNKNLNNQISILRSYNIIFKTLQELDFLVSYYHVGDVRTVELYDAKPFRIELDSSHLQLAGVPFYISVLKNNQFRIRTLNPVSANKYNIILHRGEGQVNGYSIDKVWTFGQPYQDEYMSFTLFLNQPDTQPSDEANLFFIINDLNVMAQTYKYRLQVTPETKGSSVVALSLAGPVLNKEINFLNKLPEVYIQYSLEKKNKIIINTINFIDFQLDAISAGLKESEDEREKFHVQLKSLNFEASASNTIKKLEELDQEKGKIQMSIKYCEYIRDYIQKKNDNKELVVPSSLGISDGALNGLIQQLIQLESEWAITVSRSGKTNPYMIQLEKKIMFAKQGILEDISNLIQNFQITLRDIDNRIHLFEQTITDLPSEQRRLVEIERRYRVNDGLYLFMLQKRQEAAISKAANKPDHEVVEKARALAAIQIAPNAKMIKNTALILGFLIPLGIFLAIYFLSDKVVSKEILERYSKLPVLGMVGHNFYKGEDLMISAYPKSAIAEALRSIRINLGYVAPDKKNKVVCVTSSVSGEGKSFLSSNLAALIAMTGQKVLLLGADMRKPKSYVGLESYNGNGLSTYLADKIDLEECIQPTKISNLDVILSGAIPPNPSELLSTNKLSELLKMLNQRYDYVVVDTPPVGLVSDALLIFDYCDIHLFIVRYDYTTKDMLKRLDEMVGNIPVAKNALIIFNDYQDLGKTNYYSKSNGYYEENVRNENKWLEHIRKWIVKNIKVYSN